MKKKILMICLIANQGICQTSIVQLETTAPIPIPALILAATECDSNNSYNLNAFDLSDFPQNTDFDLTRKTDPYLAGNSLLDNDSIDGIISNTNFVYEGLTYNFSGTYKLYKKQSGSLILNSDTLQNVRPYVLKENYFLIYNLDTVVNYKNNYYTFYSNDSSTMILNVFEKNRTLKGDLNNNYIGFEQVNSSSNNNINLILTPNPAVDFFNAAFQLWADGEVSISITNQDGSVDDLLFLDNLTNGTNQIDLPLTGYMPGIYTISVFYNNLIFTSQLIIL